MIRIIIIIIFICELSYSQNTLMFANNSHTQQQEVDNNTYVDYIVIAGQSNIANRIDTSNLPVGYKGQYDSVYYYKNAGLSTFTPGGDIQNGDIGKYSWDCLLLKMLQDSFNTEVKFTKQAYSNTSIGFEGESAFNSLIQHPFGSWSINVSGSHYDKLKEYINAIKEYESIQGNVARFKMLLWDQKESDCGLGGDTLASYIYEQNGYVLGNFVNFTETVRRLCGDKNMPIIYAQEMTTQACDSSLMMAEKQALYDSLMHDSYMLPLNDSVELYPLMDTQHYNDEGAFNIARKAYEIIVNNNLFVE